MNRYVSKMEINNKNEYEQICLFLENEINALFSNNQENFFVKVAVYEALNNAYQYGDFPIQLKFTTSKKNKIGIRIKDHGSGFAISEKLDLIKKNGTQKL